MSEFKILAVLSELQRQCAQLKIPGVPVDESPARLVQQTRNLLTTLLADYEQSLTLPLEQREREYPNWRVIKSILDEFDPAELDLQPIEARQPDLDYDPEEDEFFSIVYDGQQPGHRARNVYPWTEVLREWNIHRANQVMGHYTPLANLILSEMTERSPGDPDWIAYFAGEFYLNGFPMDLTVEEFQHGSRKCIWEVEAMNAAHPQFVDFFDDEEKRFSELALLGYWQEKYREGQQATGARRRKELAGYQIEREEAQTVVGVYKGEEITQERMATLLEAERLQNEENDNFDPA